MLTVIVFYLNKENDKKTTLPQLLKPRSNEFSAEFGTPSM